MQVQQRLVPHMKQYEEFAMGEIRWLPYSMFFNRAGHRSPGLNTDAAGFRLSHAPDGGTVSAGVATSGTDDAVAVLLGASPVFGLGATSDAATLPSLLAEADSIPWLNFGAPGFNSTQETILFQLHRDALPRLRDVVLYTGLNDLVVAGLPSAGADFGQFFFSEGFYREVTRDPGRDRSANQPRWSLGRLSGRRAAGDRDESPRGDLPTGGAAPRLEIAAATFGRSLRALADLVRPTGARLHVVLQATVGWSGKERTAEETALIEENERHRAQMWDLFRPVLGASVGREYSDRIGKLCAELSTPYLDLNESLAVSPEFGSWLFVDEVHFTDEGNRLAARLMRAGLDLA